MFSVLAALGAATSALRGQTPPRLTVQSGEVDPRLAARVAAAVARTWGIDTAGLMMSWGTGSLAGVPDSAEFHLLGRGEGGWFAVTFESAGRQPVAVRLRAGIAGRRLVATRALRVGMRLVEGDMREEPYLQWGPPAQESATPAPGWVVRRILTPGDPLDLSRVAPPPLVEAGQPVRLIWNEGNVSIALEGVALHAAAMGETVRVRTGGRSGVVLGTVTALGEARMQ
jgi:flagella basal body P-ring formation protein FlgA